MPPEPSPNDSNLPPKAASLAPTPVLSDYSALYDAYRPSLPGPVEGLGASPSATAVTEAASPLNNVSEGPATASATPSPILRDRLASLPTVSMEEAARAASPSPSSIKPYAKPFPSPGGPMTDYSQYNDLSKPPGALEASSLGGGGVSTFNLDAPSLDAPTYATAVASTPASSSAPSFGTPTAQMTPPLAFSSTPPSNHSAAGNASAFPGGHHLSGVTNAGPSGASPLDHLVDAVTEYDTEFSTNVSTLIRLVNDLPDGVTKQTGAQIIRITMEAMGISMEDVLSDAQAAQSEMLDAVRANIKKIEEFKTVIRKLETDIKFYQGKANELSEIIDLFILSNTSTSRLPNMDGLPQAGQYS